MVISRSKIWVLVELVASTSLCHAGPCTSRIDQMQSRIDAVLASDAAAGPAASESVDARRHRQPTPRSLAAAEEKLGEIAPEKVEVIRQALVRARAADSAGDQTACEKALGDAQKEIGQ